MSVSIDVQNILVATCETHKAGEFHESFDVVNIVDTSGGCVNLFLPHGKGPSVASAINAALSEVSE